MDTAAIKVIEAISARYVVLITHEAAQACVANSPNALYLMIYSTVYAIEVSKISTIKNNTYDTAFATEYAKAFDNIKCGDVTVRNSSMSAEEFEAYVKERATQFAVSKANGAVKAAVIKAYQYAEEDAKFTAAFAVANPAAAKARMASYNINY